MSKYSIISPSGNICGSGDTEANAWEDSGVHVNELGNWHDEEGDSGVSAKEFPRYFECKENV